MELKHAQDCRRRKCHKCGVIDEERELCATMLRDHVKARPSEAAFVKPERPERPESIPVQRLWFRYGRTGTSRFLSHLEAMNAWLRALRRAGAPLAYSNGYHPHARVAFSSALPCGEETVGDWLDVYLEEPVDPRDLLERLRGVVPDGFEVFEVREVETSAPSLMSISEGAAYTLTLPHETREALARRVDALNAASEILVKRRKKSKGRRPRTPYDLDIKPMIRHLALRDGEVPAVDVTLVDVGGKPGKPREIVPLLTDDPDLARVRKQQTLLRTGEALRDGAAAAK